MIPGIDFFHLPSYPSGWLNPKGRQALRVCPEAHSTLIPALAWSLKEAAWKALPDPVQPLRFHPRQFNILECQNHSALVEFQNGKRVLELKYMKSHAGFLSYCLPNSYGIFRWLPKNYSKALNGRPYIQKAAAKILISVTHDGPYWFSICPVE